MFQARFADLNLRCDLFGGVTTAIISLPLALAFGVASGAGAEAGLWGAILVGFFAALFGGSSTLISEPTGPMTVIMTAILTAMVARYPESGAAIAFTVVMMAGAFQILLGTLKLGKYITLMPYSVVSGFMSGIGGDPDYPATLTTARAPFSWWRCAWDFICVARFARQFKIQRAVFGLTHPRNFVFLPQNTASKFLRSWSPWSS